jgi:tetratricopeptide (TPR) repeat protein
MAIALNGIGLIARQQGDYQAAATAYKECLRLRRRRNDDWGIALALSNLGEVARDQRELQRAINYFRQSLDRFERLGDRQYLAMGLEGLASVFLLETDGVRAATLFGAADALREVVAAPVKPADRVEYGDWIEAARAMLGDRAFTSAWLVGRAMPLEGALDMARQK